MRPQIVAVSLMVSLSGCTSTLTAWKTRPFAIHPLDPDKLITATAERRLIITASRSKDTAAKPIVPAYICAESSPDAVQGTSASTKPSLQISTNGKAGLEDSYGTLMTLTSSRTGPAMLYSEIGFSMCQAWLQGVYTNDEYRLRLTELNAAAIEALKTLAQPAAAPKTEEKKGSAGAGAGATGSATPGAAEGAGK